MTPTQPNITYRIYNGDQHHGNITVPAGTTKKEVLATVRELFGPSTTVTRLT